MLTIYYFSVDFIPVRILSLCIIEYFVVGGGGEHNQNVVLGAFLATAGIQKAIWKRIEIGALYTLNFINFFVCSDT